MHYRLTILSVDAWASSDAWRSLREHTRLYVAVLLALHTIASTGCHSGEPEPETVSSAIGAPELQAPINRQLTNCYRSLLDADVSGHGERQTINACDSADGNGTTGRDDRFGLGDTSWRFRGWRSVNPVLGTRFWVGSRASATRTVLAFFLSDVGHDIDLGNNGVVTEYQDEINDVIDLISPSRTPDRITFVGEGSTAVVASFVASRLQDSDPDRVVESFSFDPYYLTSCYGRQSTFNRLHTRPCYLQFHYEGDPWNFCVPPLPPFNRTGLGPCSYDPYYGATYGNVRSQHFPDFCNPQGTLFDEQLCCNRDTDFGSSSFNDRDEVKEACCDVQRAPITYVSSNRSECRENRGKGCRWMCALTPLFGFLAFLSEEDDDDGDQGPGPFELSCEGDSSVCATGETSIGTLRLEGERLVCDTHCVRGEVTQAGAVDVTDAALFLDYAPPATDVALSCEHGLVVDSVSCNAADVCTLTCNGQENSSDFGDCQWRHFPVEGGREAWEADERLAGIACEEDGNCWMRACGAEAPPPPPRLGYQDFIANNFVLQNVEVLLVRSGVVEELDSRGVVPTLFLPWDGAFDHNPPPFWQRMKSHPQWMGHLRDFLRGHIHLGGLNDAHLTDGLSVTMINGQTHTVRRPENRHPRLSNILVIASSTVSDAELHMLDAALAPAWVDRTIVDVLRDDGRFSILSGLLGPVPTGPAPATPLSSYLLRLNRVDDRGLTLFAPTDDALRPIMTACTSTVSCQTAVRDVLDAQVVERVFSRRYTGAGELTTLGGTSLSWNPVAGTVQCTGESQPTPVSDELYALNGIIHPVDSLVCP